MCWSIGFIVGNNITSLIDAESVKNIINLSIPIPNPPVGGIPDIAIDGKNCLLFNPGDVDILAKQMDKMMSSEELRKLVASESNELAKGIFSVEKVTERLGNIYQDL